MRLRRLLGRQDGLTLIMAVGILGVLSVSGVTLVYYSSTNARSAEFSGDSASAYDLAEAGINEMAALLFSPANNGFSPYLLSTTTREYDGGTVTWSGTLDQAATPATWTLTATGRVKNPTGAAGDVQRTVTAKLKVDAVMTSTPDNQSWSYIFSTATGDPSGCDMSLNQTVNMGSPLYVAGNLCLDNTAWVSGGPLLVHGQLHLLQPQNSVGTSSQPLTSPAYVAIAGGCKWKNNPLRSPCSSADNVFANDIRMNPTVVSFPTVELDKWYVNSSPGPYIPCATQSGTPPVFDNDQGSLPDLSKRNRSVSGTFLLTPSASYSCKTPSGEISWDSTTKKLTLNGTSFIDGNARIDTSGTAWSYDGQGTLYLSGSLAVKNAIFCAIVQGSSCNWGSWNPNTELVAFVANGTGGQGDVPTDVSIALSTSKFQGGLYGLQKIQIDTAAQSPEMQGPMIAPKISINQGITTYSFPTITTGPSGLPGNTLVYSSPRPPESFS